MRVAAPSRFARWLLPGLGVKAVVIGGGYATGRELAEFFLSRGLWGGYALFIIIALVKFGSRVLAGFSAYQQSSGWVAGGITYVGYNAIGAVVILPFLRHLSSCVGERRGQARRSFRSKITGWAEAISA